MKLLFYYPYNQQVVYIESIAEKLADDHTVYLATYDEWGATHDNFMKFGATVLELNKPMLSVSGFSHLSRIKQLAQICKKHNISVVFSHYQEANLIASIAQYFCASKFVLTRHHSDCAYLDNNIKEKIGDKIINRLAREYIVPSELVYNQTVVKERTNAKKVKKIDYGYNFDNFIPPDPKIVDEIKGKYAAGLLLIKAARFIEEKRHHLLLNSLHKLKSNGLNIKLLLLGKGPLQNKVERQIQDLQLGDEVFILGYKKDIPNYFAAADLMVHFSLSEASNSAAKEAAIVETPVAVCENVGDFSDYITDQNGFLLSKEDPSTSFEHIIHSIYGKSDILATKGKQLKKDVLKKFSVENVIKHYHALLK